MKKLLFVVLGLFAFVAYADNTITSKEYVDGQVASLQTQIPAKNTNTVLTNTGTAGTIGEKAIYDTTAAYGTQTDALVTAGAFNSAVQNALESEFVCIEWQGSVHDNAHCLLYKVRGATQQQTLPAGYTQLEYIESTGTQWIDTTYVPTNDTYLQIKYKTTQLQTNLAVAATPIGGRVAWRNRNFGVFSPVNDSVWIYLYAGHSSIRNNVGTVLNKEVIAIIDIPNNYWSMNVEGRTYQQQSIIERVTYVYPLYMFQLNSAGTADANDAHIRIYYAQLKENGVFVRNFVPARRDSDGELGMYDTVTNTFFTNAGTGEFVAGPVVSSNLYLPSGNQ